MKYIIPILSLALFGAGCGITERIQEKVTEKAAETAVNRLTGGQVDVDTGEGAVEFKNNKTGETVAYGDNVKIPDDFPKTVPLMPESKAISVFSQKGNAPQWSLTLNSKKIAAETATWYEETLKKDGWEETQSFSIEGQEAREYTRGEEKMTLTIFPSDETDFPSLLTIVFQGVKK